jgi:hypothetical protein
MGEPSPAVSRRTKPFVARTRYFQPANSGRQVRIGMRQSMPSNNIDN